jgi:hypothetical protein
VACRARKAGDGLKEISGCRITASFYSSGNWLGGGGSSETLVTDLLCDGFPAMGRLVS